MVSQIYSQLYSFFQYYPKELIDTKSLGNGSKKKVTFKNKFTSHRRLPTVV